MEFANVFHRQCFALYVITQYGTYVWGLSEICSENNFVFSLIEEKVRCNISEHQAILCAGVSHKQYLKTITSLIFCWLVLNRVYSIAIGGRRPHQSKIVGRRWSKEVARSTDKSCHFQPITRLLPRNGDVYRLVYCQYYRAMAIKR